MDGFTGRGSAGAGKSGTTLVLICRDAEQHTPYLKLSEIGRQLASMATGNAVKLVDGLCHDARAVQDALKDARPDRLVLGVCSRDYAELETHGRARAAGLDPFGIQTVILRELGEPVEGDASGLDANARASLLLRAAVVRARAFPGSRPENARARLADGTRKLSRRALFTLPPISYVAVPTIDLRRCAAPTGCDLCVSACPVGALDKEADAIIVNRAGCESCGICVRACPHRAVELPGSSGDEIERHVAAILGTESEVRAPAVAYACQQTRSNLAPGWFPVPVACAAMMPAAAVLRALVMGASTVGLANCRDGCRMGQGDRIRDVASYCRQLLAAIGDRDAAARVRVVEAGAVGAPPRLDPLPGADRRETGPIFAPNAASEALDALARNAGVADLRVEHRASPLGIVAINPDACTGCGTCASACPTGALTEREGDETRIVFDPAVCVACGECATVCPELAAGAIRVARATDLALLREGPRVLFSGEQVRCDSCGTAFATRHMLDRVAAALGDAYDSDLMGRFCPECRGARMG